MAAHAHQQVRCGQLRSSGGAWGGVAERQIGVRARSQSKKTVGYMSPPRVPPSGPPARSPPTFPILHYVGCTVTVPMPEQTVQMRNRTYQCQPYKRAMPYACAGTCEIESSKQGTGRPVRAHVGCSSTGCARILKYTRHVHAAEPPRSGEGGSPVSARLRLPHSPTMGGGGGSYLMMTGRRLII